MSFVADALKKYAALIFFENSDSAFSYFDLEIEMALQKSLLLGASQDGFYVVEAENSFVSFARVLMLLAEKRPFLLLSDFQFKNADFRRLLKTELGSDLIFVSLDGEISFENQPAQALHPAVAEELKSGHSVFVVRTSGSSGLKPKFVLHNAGLFFSKYQKIGAHFQKTFAFSPLESIAGIETLLECFTHGRTLVGGAAKYNPQVILELLSNCKVDYFQTTPSFLNLLFLSGNIKDSDLSHLKKIAYGSEPTPPSLAERLHKTFPQTELCQTYGMTEIGIQKTLTPQAAAFKFKPDDLLNPIKIVDGILLVNSLTPLVGYLNYPNDFDRIWFNTGDRSSCDEDHYIQVLGREGDLINVAGRKFFPSEVEEVLLRHPDIQDVSVFAEKNPILGTAITVKVFPLAGVDERAFKASFKSFCETHLPQYMHPHRVLLLSDPLVNARFKKVRKA